MGQNHRIDHSDPTPPVETRLAALARRHHGYATRAELNAAGLTDPAIYSRTRRGRLHRRHPEVYAIGYPRTEPIALAAAAVLAGGPGAALSHGSAAALWALRRDWPDLPEVTIRGDRRSSDVRWHHSKTSPPESSASTTASARQAPPAHCSTSPRA